MPNPASVTIGNIKYSVERLHLLKLDDNERLLTPYDLHRLALKVGIHLNNGEVYSLEITAPNGDKIHIRDTDIDRGNLTEFHRILQERIHSLTNN